MIYLLLSILSSTSIVLLFKAFERFKIDSFQAIVFNYIFAASLGFALASAPLEPGKLLGEFWFYVALFLGTLFVALFNVMAVTAQKVSVAAAAIANNMSTVIPIIAAVILYGDPMPIIKVVGIIVALIGVYFAIKQKRSGSIEPKYLYLPAILFIASGIIYTLLNYTEEYHLPGEQASIFVPTLFAIAGICGIIILSIQLFQGKKKVNWKHVVGGLALGIPNYGSVYFLVKTLDSEIFESSVVFPINNMGIVALATVLAWIIFKERLAVINWIGIFLSFAGIALIAFYKHILVALGG